MNTLLIFSSSKTNVSCVGDVAQWEDGVSTNEESSLESSWGEREEREEGVEWNGREGREGRDRYGRMSVGFAG